MDIRIEDLSFSYGDAKILNHIHLYVKSGETIGIAGKSGGGKSTLLKLISGLYEIQSGLITIGDAQSSAKRRRHTAMVMQNSMLFPASIRDNITCGHSIDEVILTHACETAQLTDWVISLPQGLDTFVGERGSQVSGGQAGRIAIARAIAKNAPLILLDEPTSALDKETSSVLMSAFVNLTKEKTVLHISHQMEVLSGCDRIFFLEGGTLHAL